MAQQFQVLRLILGREKVEATGLTYQQWHEQKLQDFDSPDDETLIIGFASLIGGAFWAGSHLGGDHKPDQSSGNATSPTLPNVIPAIEPGTLDKI